MGLIFLLSWATLILGWVAMQATAAAAEKAPAARVASGKEEKGGKEAATGKGKDQGGEEGKKEDLEDLEEEEEPPTDSNEVTTHCFIHILKDLDIAPMIVSQNRNFLHELRSNCLS